MTRVKTTNDASGLDMNKFVTVSGFSEYKINRNGQVLGKSGRVLRQNVNEKGYRYVTLMSDGVAKNVKVHRLVASTFLLKGGKGNDCVNHIDGDRSNNNIRNLQWVSRKESFSRRTGNRATLTKSQRAEIMKALARKYKTLTRKDVYSRLQSKYGVSLDYLSNMNYVLSTKS